MMTIAGVALTVVSCAFFWLLLPRGGEVHPLVRQWDGGSMLTIGIMCVLTAGLGLLFGGLLS